MAAHVQVPPSSLSNMWRRLLDTLLPRCCVLCGEAAGALAVCVACTARLPEPPACCCPQCGIATLEEGVCAQCRAAPPAFDATWAAFSYGFPLDRLIQALKYGERLAVAPFLAGCLAELGPFPVTALLPVPLHPQRLRERGFNQSVELARPLARAWNLPLLLDAVVRVRHQQAAQAGLRRAQRLRNLRGAFVARQRLEGAHVLVVDDVMTTGTTLDVLARCLKAAGAARVSNLVVARTPAVH